ncbi:MAG TPA: ChbG/HpnK family deacetylase [Thermomicrobiales bacterium]|nr:ChbG/HpnK family deacetylase [Thermomicrobiales bacterium]
MTRSLIVNADDLGRSPGVTRGILQACRHGVVTSATLMVNLPWSAKAAGQARSRPRLGLGLHLSLCYGPPLARLVDSLPGPDGNLDRDLAALRERARPDAIERECRAQLARFQSLAGRLPTHLDSHQHVHSWPNAAEAVAAFAREHGLPVRSCDAAHAALLRSHGVPCPDTLITSFSGAGRIGIADLLAILRALPEGVTELMCHPGYDDDALSDSSYRAERETELRTLCAPEVRAAIAEEGIELGSFQALARA